MADATILIPTFRHTRLLPHAVASALDQTITSVEVFVVGDGVEDATREALAPFASDARVRFFDCPKGPRNGEVNRHEALREASGRIVCYLSDDDVLLRGHVAEMLRLLEAADFAHPPSAQLAAGGVLEFFPWNYARPEFREIGRGRRGSIGLTGASHTLEAYRRLPHGWRTTPTGMPTDHYMWLQFLELPGARFAMGDRLTYLHFPDPVWGELDEDDRAARLGEWLRRSREDGFEEAIAEMLRDAIRRAAEDYHLWARREQLALATLRRTRTWRARTLLLRVAPLRALLARSALGPAPADEQAEIR
jgi:GalNAc5-diNAcBac-PP-undecaprenol beta-1,3-glucosyltransferase